MKSHETCKVNNRGEFIMNPLDKLKERMETPEFAESARKYMEEYFGRIEKNRERYLLKSILIGYMIMFIPINTQMTKVLCILTKALTLRMDSS